MRLLLAALSACLLAAAAAAPGDASAAVTFVAQETGANGAGATTVVVPTPAGTADGDVLLAAVAVLGNGAVAPPTVSAPAGWTAVAGANTASGNALRQVVFLRTAGPSEPASATFTLSTSAAAAAATSAYRGVNLASPIDVAGGTAGASGNPSSAFYSYSANVTQVSVVSFATAETVTSDPTVAERFQTTSSGATTGAGVTIAGGDFLQPAAGSSSPKTMTAASPTFPWVGHGVGLRAATDGTLSLTTTNSPTFSAALNGTNRTATYTLPLTVTDTRSGADARSGWNVGLTSTTLATAGGRTLPATASRVTAVARACLMSSPCTLSTNGTTYPVTVPAGTVAPTPVRVHNAAVNTGVGTMTVTPTVSVAIPANTYAGSYTSTLTVSVANGP